MYDYRDTVATGHTLATWYMLLVLFVTICILSVCELSIYDIKCDTCTENVCESVAWQMRTMSTNYM